nr:immunoglobulin heavy chain junction region [Mus musculus]
CARSPHYYGSSSYTMDYW